MLKKVVGLFLLVASVSSSVIAQYRCVEKVIDKQAIYPRYRLWTTPSHGREVSVNPPSLLWPAADGKNVVYRVRLSQDRNFEKSKTIYSPDIEWAMFSNHKKLEIGVWYWQYGVVSGGEVQWSETNDFKIATNTPVFETPTIKEFLAACSKKHPRLYVAEDEIAAFRLRNQDTRDAVDVMRKADKQLKVPLPIEEPTRPRDTTGLTVSEKNVMMNFMYHRFGDKVKEPVKNLSMAYLLTGEKKYAQTALNHALRIAQMPPEGYATREDFNAASVMLAMAVAFDTGYGLASNDEKGQLLQAIRVRGDKFYNKYKNEFETHSMDNHVWQHTLRRLCFSSIATLNDLPEASKWLSYYYEVWCCRFPILGTNDGGWHDGSSYFQVNFETFIYMPFMFKRLTGTDFFGLPYYHNLSKFLIYSYPKDSYSTGFGDNAENQTKPGKSYWGFADALARELHDPYARWYADEISEGRDEIVLESANFAFYRMMTKNQSTDVMPKSPESLPQSLLFRDAGFALMHSDVANTPDNVMINFSALPFGATGHAHAAHNGFGVNVGGKQLFGGSGHYSNFSDKHTLMHYRTRGHNTILADGMAQVIGENGYGWIARYANTAALTYALGDATHAYGKMTTSFWIDRMKQFDVEYTKENGFGDPDITRFRRHFVFLRPNIIVIYDELKAKQPVEWTWLLHSYNKMEKGEKENIVLAGNEVADSRVDIYNSNKLRSYITNEFFSPAINWKGRGGDKPYEYTKHWHLEMSTADKLDATRFLTIIQIGKEKGKNTFVPPVEAGQGEWRIEDWIIRAEMDGQKKSSLFIGNDKGDSIEYIEQGRTIIKESGQITDNLEDVLPESAQ